MSGVEILRECKSALTEAGREKIRLLFRGKNQVGDADYLEVK